MVELIVKLRVRPGAKSPVFVRQVNYPYLTTVTFLHSVFVPALMFSPTVAVPKPVPSTVIIEPPALPVKGLIESKDGVNSSVCIMSEPAGSPYEV